MLSNDHNRLEPIRTALVGLNFGRRLMAAEIAKGELPKWLKIMGVCGQNAEELLQTQRELAVPAYASYDQLLGDNSIEAIALFTGPNGRAKLIEKAIRAGKHVLTTKPFEISPEAAQSVLEQARALGRVVHLNSPSPLPSPDMALIEQWRQQHELGRLVGARGDVWCRYDEAADGSWYDDPQQCPVAPIFRLGIYLINDLIRLAGRVRRVTVMQNRLHTGRPTADNALLNLEFEEGTLASIYASFCVGDGQPHRNALTLNFDRGTIYRNVGPALDHSLCQLTMCTSGSNAPGQTITTAVPGYSGEYQWEAFARAVRSESPPAACAPATIVEGIRIIQQMALAAHTQPACR